MLLVRLLQDMEVHLRDTVATRFLSRASIAKLASLPFNSLVESEDLGTHGRKGTCSRPPTPRAEDFIGQGVIITYLFIQGVNGPTPY